MNSKQSLLCIQIVSPLLVNPVPDVIDNVVKEGWVHVLGHLHQQEPVAVVTLANNSGKVISINRSVKENFFFYSKEVTKANCLTCNGCRRASSECVRWRWRQS